MIWWTLLGVASIAIAAILAQRSKGERVYATFEWPQVPAEAVADDSGELEPLPSEPVNFSLITDSSEPVAPEVDTASELIPTSPDVDIASVLIPSAPKVDMVSPLISSKPKVDMASMFKPAVPDGSIDSGFMPSIPEKMSDPDIDEAEAEAEDALLLTPIDENEMASPFSPATEESEMASPFSPATEESDMASPFMLPTDEGEIPSGFKPATDDPDPFFSDIDLGWMEPAFDTGDYDAAVPRNVDGLAQVRLPRGLSAVRELGHDPYGTWFTAEDRQRREVTVLRFDEEWASTPESFLHLKAAVKRAAHLVHDNIARVKWVEKKHGRVLLMGQYVVGKTLAHRLARSDLGMTLLQVFELAETLLSTLAFAHRRGVLHRDLRPRDVVFTTEDTVVLTHFGLERALNRRFGPFGPHVAPEERAGKKVDQRSDLYSSAWLIRRCLEAQPEIKVPARLDELLDSALAEDRTMRPDTANDMLQSLKAIRRTVIQSQATDSPLENLESLAAVIANSNATSRTEVLQSAIEDDIGRFIDLTREFLLQPEVELETRKILFKALASLLPVQALPALGAVVYQFNTRLAGLPSPDVPLRLIAEARALDAVLVELGGDRVERLRAVLESAFGHLLVGPMPEDSLADEPVKAEQPEPLDAELEKTIDDEDTDEFREEPAKQTAEEQAHEPTEEPPQVEQEQAPDEDVRHSSMVFTYPSDGVPIDESGRYEFIQRLRTGPVADLYLAKWKQWNQSVLVRVLRDSSVDEEAFARFELEGQKIKKLHDINVNPLFDLGAFSGRPFATEEFVDGHTLAEEIQYYGRGLPLNEVLAMGRALTAALDYAHENDVLHGDVAPENVLLVAERTWRLAHFSFQSWCDSSLANSGRFSSWYAAPEVIAGGPIDAKADVFALGATLYEALCGRRPFAGDDRKTAPIPLRKHRQSVPQALAQSVHRCLAVNSEERPRVGLLAKWLSAVEDRFERTWSQEVPAISSMGTHTPLPAGAWADQPRASEGTPQSGVVILEADDEPTREFVEATREYQDTTREYQDALFDALKGDMDEEELAEFVKALRRL